MRVRASYECFQYYFGGKTQVVWKLEGNESLVCLSMIFVFSVHCSDPLDLALSCLSHSLVKHHFSPQGEFDKFGPITDVHNTGKGYAFVTFEDKDAAETAIREMDGATLNGQQIKVRNI